MIFYSVLSVVSANEPCFDRLLDDESRLNDCRQKAQQGNIEAKYALALMYQQEKGVVYQNDYEAVQLFIELAEGGHAGAQYELGMTYYYKSLRGNIIYYGDGKSTYYNEALKWLTKSAKNNNVTAKFILGLMYYGGNHYDKNIPPNYKKAVKWIRAAAQQGFGAAQVKLGEMYYEGMGVDQDYNEALKWYKQAIKHNNIQALRKLSEIYEEGEIVSQDYVKAYMYLYISLEGDLRQKYGNDLIFENHMTPSQIEQAKSLANDWLQNKKIKGSASLISK